MRKHISILIAVLIAVSCSSDRSSIKGSIEGLDKGEIILKHLAFNNQETVDTLITEDGKISYKFKTKSNSPEFYYLYYKDNKIASFIILPGEAIKFSTDTLGMKIICEGSEETLLMQEIEKDADMVAMKYDSLVEAKQVSEISGDTAMSRSIGYQLGSLYVKQKQRAIKHLYTNPYSITNIPLLYQKFPNELPLFADARDVLLFRRVCDSLSVKYPSSPYVTNLKKEVEKQERYMALSDKIEGANIAGHPEITMPDINAKQRSLSELSGKVVVLSFWSSQDVNQRMLNQDLLQLYQKYSGRGLEIYQVSVDVDKTLWARAVEDQKLPWVSVCDGLGSGSSGVISYNISKVPAIFVIAKDGNIVARDVFGARLESVVSGLL
ncbi:MAG: TlpA disulfide reductase family protein [Rikenellaceae bacterium]|nr:TlpA disulfide reductase family protein [Rikenellaceae bacterium]